MYTKHKYQILLLMTLCFYINININAQSIDSKQKEFEKLMSQNKWSQAKSNFKYPSFMNYQYIEDVDNSIFNADVYGWGNIQIAIGYLGAWSLIGDGYPNNEKELCVS